VTRRSDDAASGFTLIELLVAIAVLALLTTLLAASLHLGTSEVARRAGHAGRSDALAATYRLLRSEIADAQPILPVNLTGGDVVFDGRPNGVSLVVPAPRAVMIAGLQLLSVEFADGQLRARWQPYAGIVPVAGREAATTVLLDRLAQVRFRYFGTLPPATSPSWHAVWRDATNLPALVGLELRFADGEHVAGWLMAPRLQPPLTGGRELLTGTPQ
jgi:prepilin-type N-terminal cleavage/methylation domain-containing protein